MRDRPATSRPADDKVVDLKSSEAREGSSAPRKPSLMVDWTTLIGVILRFKRDLGRRRKSFGWVGQFVTIALNEGAAQLSPCRSDRGTLRESNSFDQNHARLAQFPARGAESLRGRRSPTYEHIVLADDVLIVLGRSLNPVALHPQQRGETLAVKIAGRRAEQRRLVQTCWSRRFGALR